MYTHYTDPTQAAHRLYRPYTGCTEIVHRPYTSCTRAVHRPDKDRTQAVHRLYTGCKQTIHRPYTDRTQTVHRPYTDCTQTIHRPYTDCTQVTHRLYTGRTPAVHRVSYGIPSELLLAAVPHRYPRPSSLGWCKHDPNGTSRYRPACSRRARDRGRAARAPPLQRRRSAVPAGVPQRARCRPAGLETPSPLQISLKHLRASDFTLAGSVSFLPQGQTHPRTAIALPARSDSAGRLRGRKTTGAPKDAMGCDAINTNATMTRHVLIEAVTVALLSSSGSTTQGCPCPGDPRCQGCRAAGKQNAAPPLLLGTRETEMPAASHPEPPANPGDTRVPAARALGVAGPVRWSLCWHLPAQPETPRPLRELGRSPSSWTL